MHLICRTDLPDATRQPTLAAYRTTLRDRLTLASNPAERAHLLGLLDKADDSKPGYRADSPVPVGAIDLSTLPGQIFVIG